MKCGAIAKEFRVSLELKLGSFFKLEVSLNWSL